MGWELKLWDGRWWVVHYGPVTTMREVVVTGGRAYVFVGTNDSAEWEVGDE